MQRFIFEGRLTKDSELKYLPNSNNAVLSFDIAVNEGYGEYKKTDFFNCAVFGKRAESLSSYLIKGTQVICVGEVHVNKKDGKGSTPLSIACDTRNKEIINFLLRHGAKINNGVDRKLNELGLL